MNEDSNVVQYPGQMEPPWEEVAAEYTGSPLEIVIAEYDDYQVDCGDADPEPFEFHYHAPDVVVYLDIDVLPDYNSWVVDEPDPPDVEQYFDPWVDYGAAVTIINDGSTDYDASQPTNEDFEPTPESAFHPSVDAFVSDDIFLSFTDPEHELDYSIGANDEEDAAFEYAFEPWTPVDVNILAESGYVYELETPNDEDDPVTEWAYEPWTDYAAVTIVNAGDIDYDAAQLPITDDEGRFESTFEPWVGNDIEQSHFFDFTPHVDIELAPDSWEFAFEPWSAVSVSLSDYATDFPAGDQLSDESDPDTFAYSFEPWSAIPDVVLINDPATDYDGSQPVNEQIADPDPVFEFTFEPGFIIAVNVLQESGYIFANEFANEDDDPISEWVYEPWVDQGTEAVIQPPDFDSIAISPEVELELFEASFEQWVEVFIESPPFIDPSLAIDPISSPDDFTVFEHSFERWVEVFIESPQFIDPNLGLDNSNPLDEDIQPSESRYEPWFAIDVDVLGESGYIFSNEVENDQDDAVYESWMEPWTDLGPPVTVIVPGLEYTSVLNRLHYGSHRNRLNYVTSGDSLDYTSRDEDL